MDWSNLGLHHFLDSHVKMLESSMILQAFEERFAPQNKNYWFDDVAGYLVAHLLPFTCLSERAALINGITSDVWL